MLMMQKRLAHWTTKESWEAVALLVQQIVVCYIENCPSETPEPDQCLGPTYFLAPLSRPCLDGMLKLVIASFKKCHADMEGDKMKFSHNLRGFI